MSKIEVGASMAVSNSQVDLREHDEQQQQLLQQHLEQQRQQQDPRNHPNLNARPDSEHSTTQNETTAASNADTIVHAPGQDLQEAPSGTDMETAEYILPAAAGE